MYGGNNVVKVRIDKDTDDFTRYFAIETCNEMDLLSNYSVNSVKAPYREFYTIAYLYYGSCRSAEKYLKQVGIKAPHNTISTNVNAFKDIDSKAYNTLKGYDKDTLYQCLDAKSPKQDIFLPYVDGHKPEDEIPF